MNNINNYIVMRSNYESNSRNNNNNIIADLLNIENYNTMSIVTVFIPTNTNTNTNTNTRPPQVIRQNAFVNIFTNINSNLIRI